MGLYQGTFFVSTAMTANQADVNPLATWPGRFPPAAVNVAVLVNATTAGVRAVVSCGQRVITPRVQVGGGGTAGVLPNPLSNPPITFDAYPGEEIQVLLTETLGGTPTFNIGVSYEG